MSLITFLKRKFKKEELSISKDSCAKLSNIAKETESLLKEEIKDRLLTAYDHINQESIRIKLQDEKKVFEAAVLGLAIVKLVEFCEQNNKGSVLVKEALSHLQDIYSNVETGCIYNHAMKYIHEYKEFRESETAKDLNSNNLVHQLYTGAWITRYFLGEETTIKYNSAIDLGLILDEQTNNVWKDDF